MAEERTVPGMKAALTIAGSDSSGGAGIQADIKTWAAMGVFGCTVITAITAQSTRGVMKIEHLSPELVEAQIEAVAGDIRCHAVKTGMIGSVALANVIASAVKRHQLRPLVVDPVMVSKSGAKLVDEAIARALAERLFKFAAIVTPNRVEAARLLGGQTCTTIAEGMAAAKQIARKFGCHAVVVTGFERPGPQADSPPEAVDAYWTGEETVELTAEKRQSTNTHGAGCTFSAAIAGGLAVGKPLSDAVEQAKSLVSEAIRQNINIGQGNGPVNHLAWLNIKKK